MKHLYVFICISGFREWHYLKMFILIIMPLMFWRNEPVG